MEAWQTCFVLICGYARLLRQAQACTVHSPGLYVYRGDSGGPASFSSPPITIKLIFFLFKTHVWGQRKNAPSSPVLTGRSEGEREKHRRCLPKQRRRRALARNHFLIYAYP